MSTRTGYCVEALANNNNKASVQSSQPLLGGWTFHVDPTNISCGGEDSPQSIAPICTAASDCSSQDDVEGGLTPTPKEFPQEQRGVDWLNDLIQDLNLASAQSSPTTTISSSLANTLSPFRNPAEAAAYLNSITTLCRIDIEAQRQAVEEEQVENLETCVKKWQSEREDCGLETDEQRLITLRILVHEAANRSLQSLKHKFERSIRRSSPPPPPCSVDCDAPTTSPMPCNINSLLEANAEYQDARLRLYCAWKSIEQEMIEDCNQHGWQGPQRLLSCMCIFNPNLLPSSAAEPSSSTDICMPSPYGENHNDLAMRKQRQIQVVRTLKLQKVAHIRRAASDADQNEKPYLFLAAPTRGSSSAGQMGTKPPRPSYSRGAPLDWRSAMSGSPMNAL